MHKLNFFIFLLFLVSIQLISPEPIWPEITVYDMVVLKNEPVMLKAITRGKMFRRGGIVVSFSVGGQELGQSLSGGDGFAFKEFRPTRRGRHTITVQAGEEKNTGTVLVLNKGEKIVFVDVEGSLHEGVFAKKSREGGRDAISRLAEKFPVVFLRTGLLDEKMLKEWLKKNEFPDMPVVAWQEGRIFAELADKGLKIRAIIGEAQVIESAREYEALTFTFREADGAVEVSTWEEITKALL